jgi:hypothetical protein
VSSVPTDFSPFTDHPAGNRALWVLVAQHSICIAEAKAASCAPKKVAFREGLLLTTFTPPTKRFSAPSNFPLQGLVPDGVDQAVVVVGQPVHLMSLPPGR